MTVAPMIAMKSTKCESLEAVGRELDRRAHVYKNDVDTSRTHLNIGLNPRPNEMGWPKPLEQAIDARMAELNTARKIRDNQVRAMGFTVTTNEALGLEESREFLMDTWSWFAERYGAENMLSGAIHMDEGTPHIQFWVAPVIHDERTGFDRLCAKELFSPDPRVKDDEGRWHVVGEGTMTKLQREFWEQVASKYGYERPLTREQREQGYRSLEAYKHAQGTTREVTRDLASKKLEVEKADIELEKKNTEVGKAELRLTAAVRASLDVEGKTDAAKEALTQVQKKVADAGKDLQQASFQVVSKQAEAEKMQAEVDRLECLRQSQKTENFGFDQRIREIEAELERGQQPEQKPDAEPEQPKLGHELLETAKLTAAAGFGGIERIEAEQRAEEVESRDLDQRISELEDAKRNEGSLHADKAGMLEQEIGRAEGRLQKLEAAYERLENRVGELESRLGGLVNRFVERMHELTQNTGLERACERVGMWLSDRWEAFGSTMDRLEPEFQRCFGSRTERFFDEFGQITGSVYEKQQPLADAAEVARDASQHIDRGHYGIDDIMRDIEAAEQHRGFDDDDGGLWREIPAHEWDYDRGLAR